MSFQKLIMALLISTFISTTYASSSDLDMSYRRVVHLENGSNFRDGGDYPTLDGTTVTRGKLFRSAAMYAIDSENDLHYLNKFDFQTVLDLRSLEERNLQPDRWVLKDDDVEYTAYDYSFMEMMKKAQKLQESGGSFDMPTMYKAMHKSLKPQLKMYFDALLNEKTPIILHCSAGQDRTGFVSAMMLSALNVEKNLIFEDYQLSTDFRRPQIEKGDIDYAAAAKDGNMFAKIMMQYTKGKEQTNANPLRTAQGRSFLAYSFDAIESEYGSVSAYLEKEIGLGKAEIAKLKALYTH
jgi:protein-tyrosine phosphatase